MSLQLSQLMTASNTSHLATLTSLNRSLYAFLDQLEPLMHWEDNSAVPPAQSILQAHLATGKKYADIIGLVKYADALRAADGINGTARQKARRAGLVATLELLETDLEEAVEDIAVIMGLHGEAV